MPQIFAAYIIMPSYENGRNRKVISHTYTPRGNYMENVFHSLLCYGGPRGCPDNHDLSDTQICFGLNIGGSFALFAGSLSNK